MVKQNNDIFISNTRWQAQMQPAQRKIKISRYVASSLSSVLHFFLWHERLWSVGYKGVLHIVAEQSF